MSDSTKSILKAASSFFSGTLLSRISGMLRDMSMAFAFGTEASVAAFFVAFRLAHLLRRVLGEGALQSAFIPKFEELKQESPERALQFFRNLFLLLSLVLLAIILIGSVGMISLKPFLSDGNKEIISLTLYMFPSLFFICLYGLNTALLQCEKIYFIPSFAPVAFNVMWIVGAAGIVWIEPQYPMHLLGIIVVVGCALQWLVTLPSVIKIVRKWTWGFNSKDLLQFGKPLLYGILGVSATQVNSAMDALFARFAQSDGPALLWYAIRIEQLPLALFGIALSGALLPPLSRAIKSGDFEKFYSFLIYGIKKSLLLMVPITLITLIFSESIISFLFGYGHFNASSIAGTSPCLQAYTLGLIPSTLVLLLAPAFYARSNYTLPMIASVLSMIVNLCFNTLFVFVLGWGAISIALATSLSAWVNFTFLVGVLIYESQNQFQKIWGGLKSRA